MTGKQLKDFRLNKGLTQKRLSWLIGYARPYLSAIERGEYKVSRKLELLIKKVKIKKG